MNKLAKLLRLQKIIKGISGEVRYETQASWNLDKGEVYALNDPTSDICVQIPEPKFSALIDLLSDPGAGTSVK